MKFYFFVHFWANLIFSFSTKIVKNDKKCFWSKFKILIKIDFWKRNLIFESLRGSKNTKNSTVNNNTLTNPSQNPKTYWPFFNLIIPVRTIWHDSSIELDLSCSEHFFWVRYGPYSVPNDLICFESFGSPTIPTRIIIIFWCSCWIIFDKSRWFVVV